MIAPKPNCCRCGVGGKPDGGDEADGGGEKEERHKEQHAVVGDQEKSSTKDGKGRGKPTSYPESSACGEWRADDADPQTYRTSHGDLAYAMTEKGRSELAKEREQKEGQKARSRGRARNE